jgi:hypothetical protein
LAHAGRGKRGPERERREREGKEWAVGLGCYSLLFFSFLLLFF